MIKVVDPFKETCSFYKDDFLYILNHLDDMCYEYGCFTKFDVYYELCRLYDEYADSMAYEFIKSKNEWDKLAWTSTDGFEIACHLDNFHTYRNRYSLVIPWDKLETEKKTNEDMPTKNCSITVDNTKSCSVTLNTADIPWTEKEVNTNMPTKSCSFTLDTTACFYIDDFINCSTFDIDKIYYNNKTETIVVKWKNGDKTKVQLSKGDFCNLWNGVCAAVMKRKYGSNSAFKTHIEKTMGVYDDRAYMILARAETCDKYHMSYNEFKDMVNEKLVFSVKKK